MLKNADVVSTLTSLVLISGDQQLKGKYKHTGITRDSVTKYSDPPINGEQPASGYQVHPAQSRALVVSRVGYAFGTSIAL